MLYYIHGYQSTPNSAKGMLFQEKLNARSIDYHQGKPESLEIDVCVQTILNAIEGDNDPILIGSSLGGLLASKVALRHSAVKMLILLNPAIIPPRADTSIFKGIPDRILSEMIDHQLFDKWIGAQTTILMSTKDEVIPSKWILDFAMAQQATVKFLNDDHAFTSNLTRLPDIINEILRFRKLVS
jgi:predicted esterase YcpF (UPF0227 family)